MPSTSGLFYCAGAVCRETTGNEREHAISVAGPRTLATASASASPADAAAGRARLPRTAVNHGRPLATSQSPVSTSSCATTAVDATKLPSSGFQSRSLGQPTSASIAATAVSSVAGRNSNTIQTSTRRRQQNIAPHWATAKGRGPIFAKAGLTAQHNPAASNEHLQLSWLIKPSRSPTGRPIFNRSATRPLFRRGWTKQFRDDALVVLDAAQPDSYRDFAFLCRSGPSLPDRIGPLIPQTTA